MSEHKNVIPVGTTGVYLEGQAARLVAIGATRPKWLLMSVCCAVCAAGSCSTDDKPDERSPTQPAAKGLTTPPAEPPAPKPEPQPNPVLPESEAWSREEALAQLTDEATSLSAAVRLVRLAEAAPLCVPEPLSPEVARRLRVVTLSESLWALGLGTSDESRLRSPVLINADGEVRSPVSGVEEEVALLCVAADADLFPHLLIALERVWMVGDELQSALVAQSPTGLRFDVRYEDGYPYVALLWRSSDAAAGEGGEAARGEPVEVARYTYDPYEFAFMGPLADKLPDPPGGLFELDLEQSEALVPVGGEIPEPPPVETPIFQRREGEPTPY